MNNKTLALIISGLIASQAHAFDVYQNDDTKLSFGGHLTAAVGNVEGGDFDLFGNSPRINFGVQHQVNDVMTVEAKAEYGMVTPGTNDYDEGDHNDEQFYTRLGYVALNHKDFGQFTAGKAWSTYCDVACWTDMPTGFGSDQLGIYSNGDEAGTARADQSLQYRHSVEFENAGAISYGLQWQDGNSDLEGRVGGSLAWQMGELKVGVGYVTGDVSSDDWKTGVEAGDELSIGTVGVAYGTWEKGLYMAANYAEGTNIEAGYRFAGDSKHFEAIVAYGFDNQVNVYTSYKSLQSDGEIDKETKFETSDNDAEWDESNVVFGVSKYLSPRVLPYAETQISTGEDNDENLYQVGMRLFL